MSAEVFKVIEDFEDYLISTKGRCYSKITKKFLKPVRINKISTYLKFNLYSAPGVKRSKKIHRLVASAFLVNESSKRCVGHLNNDPTDNRLENLVYCTHAENNRYCADQGRKKKGSENHNSKLKEFEVHTIKSYLKSGLLTISELAHLFNVHYNAIYYIKSGKTWKHIAAA